MLTRPVIEVAGLSDVGCQRENNEDHFSYWEPVNSQELEFRGRLAIVADGMGGHEGGQEASRIAVETVAEIYSAASGNPQALLSAGFHEAHQRISRYADQHSELRGMGTTATAVALLGKHLYFAHVGDSRLYLVRSREISRLTRDHSYVSRLVENGTITAEEAEVHPQRHVLTAALGVGQEAPPDEPEEPMELRAGDALVLCTDGLWGMVADEELRDALTNADAAAACRKLIDLAKQRGGPDNITVQVLRIL